MVSENLKEHWAILRRDLFELRHLFASNAQEPGQLNYFDESLEANEFDIALHALCDCVLAASTLRITDEEIEKISLLHAKMDLRDDCVDSMRQKLV